MSSQSIVEQLRAATATLSRFLAPNQPLSVLELAERVAGVGECVQGIESAVAQGLKSSDIAVQNALKEYRAKLEQLPVALRLANEILISHRQQMEAQLMRLKRRSSWADSYKSSIADESVGREVSVNG